MKNLKYILMALVIGLAVMGQASGERGEKKARIITISLDEAKRDLQLMKAMTSIYDLVFLAGKNQVYVAKGNDRTTVYRVCAEPEEWKDFLKDMDRDNGQRNRAAVNAIIF